MANIAEALVATAIGLIVAIPAVAAFNTFQRIVKATVANTDALAHMLLAHLRAEGERPAATGEAMAMVPREASTNPRAMARPNPDPPGAPGRCTRWKRSNTRICSSGGMPGPESVITIVQTPPSAATSTATGAPGGL